MPGYYGIWSVDAPAFIPEVLCRVSAPGLPMPGIHPGALYSLSLPMLLG
jgi:hypothetical protein